MFPDLIDDITFIIIMINMTRFISVRKNEEAFNKFSKDIDKSIENNFKVYPSYIASKQNRLFNPWITGAIITSVQTKNIFIRSGRKRAIKIIHWEVWIFSKGIKSDKKVLRQAILNAKKILYARDLCSRAHSA